MPFELSNTLLEILPLWVVVFVVVVFVLHKTGTLNRMSKVLNMWLKSIADADKARRDFKSALDKLEAERDAEIERVIMESQIVHKTNYDSDNLRLRNDMFEVIKSQLDFLRGRVVVMETFVMALIAESKVNFSGANNDGTTSGLHQREFGENRSANQPGPGIVPDETRKSE